MIIDKNCDKKNFCLFHVTPCLDFNGQKVALLGEQSKWVPVSMKRVLRIYNEDSTLNVQIQGAVNERIEFSFLINEKLTKVECNFTSSHFLNIAVSFGQQPNVTCH